MPADHTPKIIAAGDCGILILFGDQLDMAVNNAAHAFDGELRTASISGIEEITPGIRSVLVRFNPLQASFQGICARIQSLLDSKDWLQSQPNPDRKIWRLPALYDEETGPDLLNVANQLGLSVEKTIAEHASSCVRVLMLGFAPGCAYLGSLPERWDLPRLDYVKNDVAAGSLSVAVRQTVLFATEIPTGWQTIGQTPFLSFSRSHPPYFFLNPGDEITFEPIDRQLFEQLRREVNAGKQIVTPETPQ